MRSPRNFSGQPGAICLSEDAYLKSRFNLTASDPAKPADGTRPDDHPRGCHGRKGVLPPEVQGPSYPLERPWLALLNDPAGSRLNCACGLVVKT